MCFHYIYICQKVDNKDAVQFHKVAFDAMRSECDSSAPSKKKVFLIVLIVLIVGSISS